MYLVILQECYNYFTKGTGRREKERGKGGNDNNGKWKVENYFLHFPFSIFNFPFTSFHLCYNSTMERKIVKLLGFNIDTFDFETAINYAKDLIESKKGGQIITINPEMIEFGLKNSEFAQILNDADLVIPDGVGVKIGLKIKGINTKRIAGIEFSYRLIEECAKNNFPIALIGAKPNILQKASEKLKSEIEGLNIIYTMDGYFQDREQRLEGETTLSPATPFNASGKDRKQVLTALAENKPQFILIALGSPKQEEFIKEARKLLPEALMIGVGGSFDVWSGEVERAPAIFQKLGIEWLYRTVKEPYRLKRIFPTLPRFLFRVLFS